MCNCCAINYFGDNMPCILSKKVGVAEAVMATALMATTIVLVILIEVKSFSHLKSAGWACLGSGSFFTCAAFTTFICQARNHGSSRARTREHLDQATGSAIVKKIVVRSGAEPLPTVYVSQDIMESLFSPDAEERIVLLGDAPYLAKADRQLGFQTISLDSEAKTKFLKDLKINENHLVYQNIQIFELKEEDICLEKDLKVIVSIPKGTKFKGKIEEIENTLRRALTGQVFYKNQTLHLEHHGVSFDVASFDVAFKSTGKYFRLSEGFQIEFDIPKGVLEIDYGDETGLTIVQRLDRRGVGGLPPVLNDVFQPFIDMRNHEKKGVYQKWHVKISRGILFEGPPGTGKTSIAKHIGKMLGCSENEIKVTKGSDILGELQGQSEKNIKGVFEAPSGSSFFVIIIDEADSLFRRRSGRDINGHNSETTEFLQQIDGIDSRDNFLLIAITNHAELIDPAFLRPGRLTHRILIGLPDKKAREHIFSIYLKNLIEQNLTENIDIPTLADQTEGFSGAEIEQVVELAKKIPLAQELSGAHDAKLRMQDLLGAIKEIGRTKVPI